VLFNTVLFTGNANPALAQQIASNLGIELGKAKVGRFSDGEVDVEIQQNVRARDIFVVQPTCAPTNENLMELCIMVDAIKRASARRVTAVIPYFGYARRIAGRARRGFRSAPRRRQPARGGRRRAAADDGPARRPDPGLLQHPGRQHLRVAGAAVRPAVEALRRPGGGLARRRRRRPRPRAGEAGGCELAIIDKRRPKANVSEVMHVIGESRAATA
jgi:ribose-phosphate pyrophosphokinase